MPLIKRLGPGDETLLELLAIEESDFDLEGRGSPLRPLDVQAARSYLNNASVLHWAAFEEDAVIGHLYCILLPLRAIPGQELLLYEIGVRRKWRKRGVGRALLLHMENWMRENDVPTVWVLADNPSAVDFYRACDFAQDVEDPLYMMRDLSP
jgi:GNAT superfamily N-acetyltransferase